MLYQIKVKNFSGIDGAVYQLHQPFMDNAHPAQSLFYGRSGSGKTSVATAIYNSSLHLGDGFDQNLVGSKFNVNFSHFDSDLAEFEFTFIISGSLIHYSYGKNSYGNIVYESFKIDGQSCISIDRRKSPIANFCMDGAESLKTDFAKSNISAVRFLAFNSVLNPTSEKTVVFNAFMDFIRNSLFADLGAALTVDGHKFRQLSKQSISTTNDISEFQFILDRCGFSYEIFLNDFSGSIDIKFGSSRHDFFESSAYGAKVIFRLYCLLKMISRSNRKPSLIVFDNADELFINAETYKWLSESVENVPTQLVFTSSVFSDFFSGQKNCLDK